MRRQARCLNFAVAIVLLGACSIYYIFIVGIDILSKDRLIDVKTSSLCNTQIGEQIADNLRMPVCV